MVVTPLENLKKTLGVASANGISIVAVSKRQPEHKVIMAYEQGYRDFGESTLKGLLRTQAVLAHHTDVRLHFVGPLQSNKIKKLCLANTWMIHSIGHTSHLEKLKNLYQDGFKIPKLLLQVNAAQNPGQSGFDPDESTIVSILNHFSELTINGLMVIGPEPSRFTNKEEWRQNTERVFQTLKSWQENIQGLGFAHFCETSMGMSADWSLALKHGATIIRLGTTVFGPRN